MTYTEKRRNEVRNAGFKSAIKPANEFQLHLVTELANNGHADREGYEFFYETPDTREPIAWLGGNMFAYEDGALIFYAHNLVRELSEENARRFIAIRKNKVA